MNRVNIKVWHTIVYTSTIHISMCDINVSVSRSLSCTEENTWESDSGSSANGTDLDHLRFCVG